MRLTERWRRRGATGVVTTQKGDGSALSARRYSPVVVNCVFTLLPMIPWRPILALMNPTATNVSAFVHAGSPLISATLPWPLFHAVSAAAMVNSA